MTLDLKDRRFGKLVAKYPTDKRYGSSIVWHCLCDCGNTAEVPAGLLNLTRRNRRKSCGCVRYDKIIAHHRSKSKGAAYLTAWRELKSLRKVAAKFGVTVQAVHSSIKNYRKWAEQA